MTLSRGQLVILFIFGLSALMGGYAWWHHYQQGRKCLELWGSEGAVLIGYAPQVEAIELAPSDPSAPLEARAFLRMRDISTMPGLLNARAALIQDGSYEWNGQPTSVEPDWRYALRFSDGRRQITLAFDAAGHRLRAVAENKQGILDESKMRAFMDRIPQWLEEDPATPPITPSPPEAPAASTR